MWVLGIVGGLVGLVAVLALVGLTLRADHQLARTIVVATRPAEVFAVVRDVDGWPAWRGEVKRIEPRPDVDGRRAFVEHARHDKVPYVIEVDEAAPDGRGGRLVTRIVDDGLPFGGHWVIDVAAEGPGGEAARVTITEDGIVKNPVFRALSRTVYSLASTQERWLRALGARFGAEVTPAQAEPVRWRRG